MSCLNTFRSATKRCKRNDLPKSSPQGWGQKITKAPRLWQLGVKIWAFQLPQGSHGYITPPSKVITRKLTAEMMMFPTEPASVRSTPQNCLFDHPEGCGKGVTGVLSRHGWLVVEPTNWKSKSRQNKHLPQGSEWKYKMFDIWHHHHHLFHRDS